MDAMLAVSTQESEIDAFWLNEVFGGCVRQAGRVFGADI